jgi:two-component system, OmpR family, sensor kinase
MENKQLKFSLLCDPEGGIKKVLQYSDPEFSATLQGKMIFSMVTPGDLDKLLNFFLEIKQTGSAIGWQINLSVLEEAVTFSFFGGRYGTDIVIAAATAPNSAEQLFEEVTRINNEQTNIIRSITKEHAKMQPPSDDQPVSFYEELSRLNNELVNMQRELAKKNRELESLNKLKNQFLGIAAHDLRSPIGVIMGYSEYLLDNPDESNPEEKTTLIHRINNTANFMLGLVNDLLDIANIESGQLELNLSEQDLDEVIRAVIHNSEIFTRAKSIKVDFIASGNPVTVTIDRPKIEQVITNLLSNAIKYSFPNTTITIVLSESENQLLIRVMDQGQGIREEELGKLFRPFQKTSTRSTAGEKSTGLGLSIVKKIVEAHGGKVGVKSIFGAGSEFFLTLPC